MPHPAALIPPDTPPPDPFWIPPRPERRRVDTGPPPGTPERRRPLMPDFHNNISFGQLLQAATVAGGAISAIFTAGQYVQRLSDELTANRSVIAASDAQITAAIQRLLAAQLAAQSTHVGSKPP
jgi:hypothetical protein